MADAAAHARRAAAVAAQIVARPPGAKVTVRKRSPSHSIRDAAYKRDAHPVDVSSLESVLAIEPVAMTATVEGQVQMGQLVAATMAHGLLPRVVPEFRDFTVAGLINGEGIQSSSHRHGVFTQTVAAVELVLGDGSVVWTSPEQHPDLFGSLPGSLGTLGLVTAATLRLMPSKPYVRSTYRGYASLDAYLAAFEEGARANDVHGGRRLRAGLLRLDHRRAGRRSGRAAPLPAGGSRRAVLLPARPRRRRGARPLRGRDRDPGVPLPLRARRLVDARASGRPAPPD